MKATVRAILLGASAIAPALAHAQAVPPSNVGTDARQPDVTEADAGGIPEIVVTARKTAETLSDAPVAVSVVTSEVIAERGLNSIDDFAKNATGISFSQAFGRSTDRPVIRGQSNVLAGVQAGVETGAAYFVDGVYYQGDIQGFDPLSIERVEIIKGPQSALYGRNTYAGAINYITKAPSDRLSVSGRARAAEHDEYELAASVSGPVLGEMLGFRAGARYFTYGGEYTNQLTGKKVGDEETKSAYLTLDFNPLSDLHMRTRGSWQKDDDGPLAIFLQGAVANNCKPGFRSPAFRTRSSAVPFAPATLTSANNNQYFCGVIQPQPNNVRLNTDPLPITIPAGTFIPPSFNTAAISGTFDGTAFDGVENEQYLLTNVLDWDLGGSGWIVSSLTGYRDNKNFFGTDSDHSDAFAYFNTNPAIGGSIPNPLVTEPAFANTNRDDQSDFSQELRIASPADRMIRFVVGGYYFKQKFRSVDITFASGKQGEPLGTDLSQRATIENKAAFGLVEVKPTDAISITGEIRYAEETKTLIDRSSASATGLYIFSAGASADDRNTFGCTQALVDRRNAAGVAIPGCVVLPKAKFTGWDPRVTVNYTTPGGTLLYGVFATGRKPGGFNGTAGQTATLQTGQDFTRYLPEKSRGGEIGVKFDALDRTLRIAAAGFYNKLTDVQLTSAIPNPSGTGAITSIVTNSGDASTKGFELEAQMAPSRNFLVTMGVSYVDASFTKGCDADEFILNSGGLRPNFDTRNPTAAGLALCDISGRKLPLGSPWIVNGSVSWDRELGSNGLSLFALSSFSYEDSKFVQVHNLAKTGDTFLLNARLGIRSENFTIALFGRNLTDEDSIPLATRWFDLRYGAGTRGLPAGAGNPPTQPFDGKPAQIETGTPRGFFATLRKGRSFGVEATFDF
jgi:outer membrane receptor protein involved in Fe transport